MRVIHVAPTPFGHEGLLGGGERYPLELARALAAEVDCELISFGPRPRRHREPGGLRLRTLRPLAYLYGHPAHPLAPGLAAALAGADLVHTHHMRSTPGRLAASKRNRRRAGAVAGCARGRVVDGIGDLGFQGLAQRRSVETSGRRYVGNMKEDRPRLP